MIRLRSGVQNPVSKQKHKRNGKQQSLPGSRPGFVRWLVFAAMTAVTVYVILDIEYPRLGLIRVDAADQVLVELRESMK